MELLTVDEAAIKLRVNADTIRRWLRLGTLTGKKIGRSWLIPQDEIAKKLA